MADLDQLNITIESDSSEASKEVDRLADSLENLKKKCSGLSGLTSVSQSINSITRAFSGINPDTLQSSISALSGLKDSLSGLRVSASVGSNIASIANSLTTLNNIDRSALDTVKDVSEALSGLSNLHIGSLGTSIENLANGLDMLTLIDTSTMSGALQDVVSAMSQLSSVGGLDSSGITNLLGQLPGFAQSLEGMDMTAFQANVSAAAGALQPLILALQQLAQVTATLPVDFTQLIQALNAYNNSATTAQNATRRTSEDTDLAARAFQTLRNGLQGAKDVLSGIAGIFSGVKGAVSSLAKGVSSLASKFSSLLKHLNLKPTADKSTSALSKLFASIKRIALYRLIRSALSAMTNSMKEGIKNVYQYSSAMGTQFKGAMDSIATSTLYAKNSLGAFASGILTALAPAIDSAISLLVSFINTLSQLFAMFSGAASWTKAVKSATEYEDAVSGAGSAAKDLKKTVMGFDELNLLTDTSDSGGGGGSTATDYSSMFEEVDTEATFSSWGEAFSSAIDTLNSKIPELESTLSAAVAKVNDFSANVYEMFTFPGLDEKVSTLGTNISTSLSNAFGSIDWATLGSGIGSGFNLALSFLSNAISGFDFTSLGSNLATSVNDIVANIDWSNLGSVLWSKFSIPLNTFSGFFTNLDMPELATAATNLVTGFFDSITTTIQNIDWNQVGEQIRTFLVNVDWAKVARSMATALGTAFGALCSLLAGALDEAIQGIVDYFTDWANWGADNGPYEDVGLNMLYGVFEGIKNAITDVGTWIYDNIVTPFLDGFKEAFGIHSPSTVMEEQGEYITEGLKEGISNPWEDITDFFDEKLTAIGDTIESAWESVKTNTAEAWSNVKETVSDKWEEIKSSASETWSNLKTTVSDGWSSIKSKTSTTWSNVTSSLSTTWESVKSKASSTWENLKTTVSDAWDSITGDTSSSTTTVESALSDMGDTVSQDSTWSDLSSTVSGAWDDIDSQTTAIWAKLKSSLASTWKTINQSASSTAADMKSVFTGGWSDIGANIVSGIKSGISNGWSTLTSYVKQAANNLLSATKSALGIHSPSRLFRDEVGLNIGLGIGEGVEDSVPSVIDSVSGVSDAIAKTIGNTADTISLAAQVSVPDASQMVATLDLSALTASLTYDTEQIADGVADGVQSANEAQNALLRQQNELLRQILEKTGNGSIDWRKAASTITSYQRQAARAGG